MVAMQQSRSAAEKRKKFRKFVDYCCPPRLYIPALRLLLPSLDRQRGSYGLKESVLATSLVDALAMSRDSGDALHLLNWRKGGPKSSANVAHILTSSTLLSVFLFLIMISYMFVPITVMMNLPYSFHLSLTAEAGDCFRIDRPANVALVALVAILPYFLYSFVLQQRQGTASGGLTIAEVIDLLDRLATSENRS